jgi:hypothetical protein
VGVNLNEGCVSEAGTVKPDCLPTGSGTDLDARQPILRCLDVGTVNE